MKKTVTIILTITLILALAGCKKIDNTSSDSDLSSAPVISSTEENTVSSEDNGSDVNESSSEESNNNLSTATTVNPSSTGNISSPESTIPSTTEPTKETNNTDKTSNGVSSNNTNNQSSDSGNKYIHHSWSIDPDTGEKIEGSDSYMAADGKVYDSNGNFLYDNSEWLIFE